MFRLYHGLRHPNQILPNANGKEQVAIHPRQQGSCHALALALQISPAVTLTRRRRTPPRHRDARRQARAAARKLDLFLKSAHQRATS